MRHGCRKRAQTTQRSSAAFRLRLDRRGERETDVKQADWGEAGGSEDGKQEGKGKVRKKKTCEKRDKAGDDIQHGKRVKNKEVRRVQKTEHTGSHSPTVQKHINICTK